LLDAGDVEFLAGVLPFIREGVEAGEPVLVVSGSPSSSDLPSPSWPLAAAATRQRQA
jgi:hypothetical protein